MRDYPGGAIIITRVLPGGGQKRQDRGGGGHSDTGRQATKCRRPLATGQRRTGFSPGALGTHTPDRTLILATAPRPTETHLNVWALDLQDNKSVLFYHC